jgi:hypothetical protein
MGDGSEISESTGNISTDKYFDTYVQGHVQKTDKAAIPAQTEMNESLRADSEKVIQERVQGGPPVPSPHKSDIIASSSGPPVPVAMLAATDVDNAPDDGTPPFAVRQVDLNRDGSVEEIIQNAAQADGLLDISIVKNGREIFFGRGKQIKLLSTRNTEGWEDIGIKSARGTVQVYRYSPKDLAYTALN